VSNVKKTDQKKFQKVLIEQRDRLAINARRALTGDIHLDPDDFSDEIDSASAESGLAFVGRLRERERALLQKIEASLAKIEAGTFGTCVQCGEDIGLKRLEARPVASLCIDCKSQQEKLEH
jgi:DnaK suppressor protein